MLQNKILLTSLTLCAFAMFGGGCGGEEEKSETKVVQQRPKAPPKPKAKTIAKLVASLSIDPRVQFDEKEAPRSEAQRIAILNFFNAMLNTDTESLKSMMSFKDQLELDAMSNEGLSSFMNEVSLVMLKTGDSPEGKPCVMAIYEIDLDYQVQLWYIENTGQNFTFIAVETPPRLVDKLSGNWITNYFEWKSKQTEIAQQPDEESSYALAGESTSSSGNQGGGGGGSPGGPRPPGGPGGPLPGQ